MDFRKVIVAAAMGYVLVASSAAAQEVSECREIEDNEARLACFDGSSTPAPDKAAPEAEARSPARSDSIRAAMSRWDVSSETSPLDDSETVIASLAPSSTSYAGIGDETANLIIRCRENTTSAYIATAGMFMTGDTVPVTYRLDDRQAVSTRWDISSNYRAAGQWSGSSAIPFIRELAEANRLFIRIDSRQRLDATFTLVGIEEAVAEVQGACGW